MSYEPPARVLNMGKRKKIRFITNEVTQGCCSGQRTIAVRHGNWFWSFFGHKLREVCFNCLMDPHTWWNYYIIPWPIWVLADLYIMPFNDITSNNDCNLIPPVGKLGASNMFNVHCSMLDCNLSFAISGWRFEPPPSVPWHMTLLTKPRSSEGKNVCVSRKVKTPLLSQFLGYKIFN